MTDRQAAAHLPILSIITMPEGLDRASAAALLADHSGLDAPTLRLRFGSPPPLIIGQMPAEEAARAISAWRDAGGEAFSPTMADIQALGPTRKIRDLRLEQGDLAVDLWRGGNDRIKREDVRVLVRAHLHGTKTVQPSIASNQVGRRMIASSLAMGTPMGLAAAIHAHWEGAMTDRQQELDTSDKLDIHTADGRVFQIDGDKFGYQALGEMRRHSDRENMDRMCELLAHVTPNEVVDAYFTLWKAPALVSQFRLTEMTYNKDVPAFAFYSRWAALMYRYLLG